MLPNDTTCLIVREVTRLELSLEWSNIPNKYTNLGVSIQAFRRALADKKVGSSDRPRIGIFETIEWNVQ